MTKNSIKIAVMTVFAAASCAAAGDTLQGLNGAGEKIAAVDIKKNYSEAGGILDGFFSGSAAKKGTVPEAVSAGATAKSEAGPARNAAGQTAAELVNAKPTKIARIPSKVAPLAAQTRGAGGSSWTDDLNTVVDYVTHVGSAGADVADDITCGPNGTCTDDNNPAELPGHLHNLNDALNCKD